MNGHTDALPYIHPHAHPEGHDRLSLASLPVLYRNCVLTDLSLKFKLSQS